MRINDPAYIAVYSRNLVATAFNLVLAAINGSIAVNYARAENAWLALAFGCIAVVWVMLLVQQFVVRRLMKWIEAKGA